MGWTMSLTGINIPLMVDSIIFVEKNAIRLEDEFADIYKEKDELTSFLSLKISSRLTE